MTEVSKAQAPMGEAGFRQKGAGSLVSVKAPVIGPVKDVVKKI